MLTCWSWPRWWGWAGWCTAPRRSRTATPRTCPPGSCRPRTLLSCVPQPISRYLIRCGVSIITIIWSFCYSPRGDVPVPGAGHGDDGPVQRLQHTRVTAWHVTHDTRDTHDNLCNAVTFAQIALATRPTSRHLRPPDSRQRRCGAVSANSNILQTLVQGSSERFHDTLQKFILRRVVRNAAWAGLGWVEKCRLYSLVITDS